jgi:Clp amino terminal domain, pathogenicity island component
VIGKPPMTSLQDEHADKLVAGVATVIAAAAALAAAAGARAWLTIGLAGLALANAVFALSLRAKQASRAVTETLPLESGLEALLDMKKERCRRQDVPVLTPHILHALLAPAKGAAARAFDVVRPGLADEVRGELEAYERSDALRAPEMHFADFGWRHHDAVKRASALARRERAPEIGQAHLLVAVLESSSGTVASLKARLGQAQFERLVAAAREPPARIEATPGAVFPEASR